MSIVVSESNSEETLQAYAHPLSIQAKAISGLEERILNGDVVADGNNVFTYLTEFAANTVADAVNRACMCFNSLYPENAQTSTDLYKHLSDFDYIGLYSTPAELTVELIFDRTFLIDNCVQIDNSSYYKIIIPEYSKFTVGEYIFGLMYPIEIRIRKAYYADANNNATTKVDYDNCAIAVMWDTTNSNPLKTLETHVLEHRDFIQEGQTLTAIEVPIYQFEVSNHVDNAIASTGFAKRYDYMNKFYAVRVYHFKNGKWNEMAQTLSDINYDVDKPTAMIKILIDIGKVEVVIPQIYFNTTNEDVKIGNRILVKIYNTKGELNLDISEYNTDQFSASFLMTDTILVEDDTYSNMLKRIPTIYMLPASKRISSGTDGITMSELKERVKHSASYTVKITPDDLDAYFATSGFTFTKELDNITDRVYCAHKSITDSTGITVASGDCKTVFMPKHLNISIDEETGDYYVPGYSSISVLDNHNITILPTAVYKYDDSDDSFTMLSDDEVSELVNTTQDYKVATLNNNLYTFSPFHIRLSLDNYTPIAGSYDLYSPSLKSIVFDWENPNTTSEIAIYTASISPLETDSTGFRLNVALFKTNNLANVEPKVTDGLEIYNIHVMLSTTTSEGVFLYMLGEYNGKDNTDHDVFTFDIKSSFKITKTGMIDVINMYDSSGASDNNFIDLSSRDYTLRFFVKEEFVTDSKYPMDGVPMDNIPGILDGYVHLCTQTFKLTLGKSLPLIKNNVTISVSDEEYQKYPTTQFSTYNSNIYYRWTIADYKNGVIDPITGEAVTAAKIGSLKLNKEEVNEYYLTSDTTFKSNKDYYTKSSSGYVKATVVVGQAVPANTYYNLKKYKYTPVIQYKQGDVIINSQYGLVGIGPVMTITDNDVANTLTLDSSVCEYTATSDLSNNWKSIDGGIFVAGSKYTAFTGMYASQPTVGSVTNKVWTQSHYSEVELYDTTTMDIQPTSTATTTPTCNITLYRYLDDNGCVVYSITLPPVTKDYTTHVFNIASSDDKSKNFKSSNSDIVKSDSYVKSTKNITVNTSARGLNRKWYLIDPSDTSLSYDFENDTGFIIEYTASSTSSVGIDKSWCLNYNYRTTTEDGLLARGVVIIDSNLKSSSSSYLNDNDKTKLDTDSYVAQYQEIYHKIHYVSGINPGWYIGETVNSSDSLVAVQDYYYGPAIENPDGSFPQPWETEWVNLISTDKSEILVTCSNNTDNRYCAKIEDALNFVINYIKDNGQQYQDASKLSRYIDCGILSKDATASSKKTYYTRSDSSNPFKPFTYTPEILDEGYVLVSQTSDTVFKDGKTYWTYDDAEEEYVITEVTVGDPVPSSPKYYDQTIHYEKCDNFLVDYLPGIIFTCVGTCTDGRTQEYCNSQINYYPGTVDSHYVDRQTAVGTDDALGAVYYRSTDFLDFDFTDYGLTYDQLISIVENWNKYKIYSESIRYKYVAEATGVKQEIIRLIVSDTEACYFTPWVKMVNVSSYDALCLYYNTRMIVNCTVADLTKIQSHVTDSYESFDNLTKLKAATAPNTYELASGKVLYGVVYYTRTEESGEYVYTPVDLEVGTELTANTYYTKVYKTVFIKDITELDEVDDSGTPTTKAIELRTWLGLSEDEGVSIWSSDSLLGTANKPTCAFVKWSSGLKRGNAVVSALPVICGFDASSMCKSILSYGTHSGYMYVFTEYPDEEYSTGTCKYINYTSKIDRTYSDANSTDGSTITRNEFNVNFETSIWTEIDKWPWEIETPWIDATTGEKSSVVIEYNKDISCTKPIHLNTDVMLDSDGNPVVAESGARSKIYSMNMIHCDYKLSLSDDTDYDTYITDIRELLRSYFNELNTISPSLLARTKMYYTPIKTFGNAQFKGNGGIELTLPLEFTLHLALHVQSFVNGSDLNKTTIRNNILSIIDKRLKSGYLSMVEISSDIMNEISDNIICIDVLGINSDTRLQTMIPVNSDCVPQLKQDLELNDDGTISVIRRLDITWYVIE